MNLAQSLRIHIGLSNIHITADYNPGGAPFVRPTYLWMVFFKIDGDTTFIDEKYNLKGTATILGTPGNHGNLGGTASTGDVSVPASIGEWRTILQRIPLKAPIGAITDVAAAIGCLAILLANNGTPDEAIAAGHDALNNAVQSALNNLIPTLGMNKVAPGKDDIAALQQRVGAVVEATIKDNVSFWQFLGSAGSEDFKIGSNLFLFSQEDLKGTDPTGLPLQATFWYLEQYGPAGYLRDRWDLTGALFADPYDFSLRRFMAFRHLIPANGIRTPMGGEPSIRQWIVSSS